MPHPALTPLFGTRCRTEGFARKDPLVGRAQYLYYEAYRDHPQADSWTVRQYVVTESSQDGKSYITTGILDHRLPFARALALLARHEGENHKQPTLYSPLFPNAAALRFNHFRAFAEREGYVFDIDGKPHARPGPGLVPEGATFDQAALDAADRHLERPLEEFGPVPLARRLPDTLFLFDAFNRRAIGKQQGSELAGLRVLNLMDGFVGRIDKMNAALAAYAAAHLSPAAPVHIATAEKELVQARNQLRQIAAYGMDVSAFEKMADECSIVIQVMHAQGIYDQLRRSPAQFDDLEAQFKKCANQAMALYTDLAKKLPQPPKGDEGYVALQEMIIQGGAPVLPGTIATFVTRYRQQRNLMIAPAKAAPPPKL